MNGEAAMEDRIAHFLDKARSAFGDDGAALVAKALEWSEAHHEQSLRASGEPALEHDFRVASTLLDMGMDLDSVVAGGIHDTTTHRVSGYHPPHGSELSDTSAGDTRQAAVRNDLSARSPKRAARQDQKQEEHLKEVHRKALGAVPDPAIVGEFGADTAQIVAEVARLSSVRAKNKTVQAAETMRKMLFAMTGDIRVIIVKLADKLDSMRTLKWLPEDRQKTIAAECLDIFAPLADRLGISWLKDELEDLSLKVINREAFDQIKDIVSIKKATREKFLAKVSEEIRRASLKAGINLEISSRAKHFYSIYQKMRKKGKPAEELYDLLGLRLICDTDNDCYALLGLVHRPVEADGRKVQRLHSHAEGQWLQKPAHDRHVLRRAASGSADTHQIHARHSGIRCRFPLALQERNIGGKTPSRGPADRQQVEAVERVRFSGRGISRGNQAGASQGFNLRLHSQGRGHRASLGGDSHRFCLRHTYGCGLPLLGGKGRTGRSSPSTPNSRTPKSWR